MTVNVCIVTFPIGRAGSTPLSNLVKLVSQSTGKTYLICSGVLSQSLSLDDKVIVFKVAHRTSSNAVIRAINHICTQFKIMCYMVVASKEMHAFIFFLGGENLLIPMLASKLLRKKTLLVFSEIARKVYSVRNDPLSTFISMLVSLNSFLADKLVLYSHNIICDGNFTGCRHKIIIAHRHFVDFTQFVMKKKISGRANVVGYIGRFNEEKGILNLVKSIPIVLKYRKYVRFELHGEGKLFDEIRNILQHEGLEAYVKLAGWVSHKEVPAFLNEINLLVLPSYTEGLPNVMLEAMACGTPILATSVGAIPDIIKDGENGFVLKSNDPQHIAERIIEILDQPELLERVSLNAYNNVRKNFNYEKTLRNWQKIIADISFSSSVSV